MAKTKKAKKTLEEINDEVRLSCLFISDRDDRPYGRLVATNGWYDIFCEEAD